MSYDPAAPNPGPVPFPAEIDPAGLRRIHILAIAGTGMGSFAGLLQAAGYEVTGTDENVYPPMSEKLVEWGIEAWPGFRPENLDRARPDLVVVGNVVRKVNPEATAMRERGLAHASFPATLGRLFLERRRSVVVAGTHGKTTTTALLSHLLVSAGRDPSFLVGGVPGNFSDSFRLGAGPEFVLEGDEYDTAYFDKGPKFLHYRPKVVQFTGAEFDHADIYRDLEHYESSFLRLFSLLPADGFLAACSTFESTARLVGEAPCAVETYSARAPADVRAQEITLGEDGAHFTVVRRGSRVGRFHLPLGGLHNVENATGAVAVALHLGVSADDIARGLHTFAGVRRRQEVVTRARDVVLVDDFAHHPTAVAETIAAVRARFPRRRLWAVFEPRSNTASRALHQHAYEGAFAAADEVLLATPRKIANVDPSERLDVDALARVLTVPGTRRARCRESAAELAALLLEEARPGDVVLVMSNGAFDGLVPRLRAGLEAPPAGAPGEVPP